MLLLLAALLGTLFALPSSAGAVLSGVNGNILFTSGAGGGAAGDDSQAKLYLRSIIGSAGGGTQSATVTPIGGGQYKHATWSPDRTKIAYAFGTPGASYKLENFDIYIKDLTSGLVSPITDTTDNLDADRPAWSPDGQKIVFEEEPAPNTDTGLRDLMIYDVASGNTTDLTNTPTGTIETDAAWTPDSQTLYYQTGDLTGTNNLDIVKQPAAGGSVTPVESDVGSSEFQPSISPDGTKFCFTLGNGFSSSTSLIVAPVANPAGGTVFSTGNGGNIDCTWSPDGTKIAYTEGVFTSGALVMKNSDGSSLVSTPLVDNAGHFDGNADWAPDGRPVCKPANATTTMNKPVVIALVCNDTGPAYEQTPVKTFVSTSPTVGTASDVTAGANGAPDTIVYTPKTGFLGTVTFQFNGFDSHAFATPPQNVTVKVNAPAGTTPGKKPVISKLKVAKTIHRSRAKPKLQKRSKGATITFTLSENATVTVRFTRTGAATAVKKGSLTVSGKQGVNRLAFHGRLSGAKTLIAGKYKITLTARDAAKLTSAPVTKRFKLK